MLFCLQQISDKYYFPPTSPSCELQLYFKKFQLESVSFCMTNHMPSLEVQKEATWQKCLWKFVLSLLILQLLEDRQDCLADVSEKSSDSDKCS